MGYKTGNLTVKQCEQATIPDGKQQLKLYDGNGLLQFLRGKRKVWRFKYKAGGKEKLYTIGPFPRVSITNTRKEAALPLYPIPSPVSLPLAHPPMTSVTFGNLVLAGVFAK